MMTKHVILPHQFPAFLQQLEPLLLTDYFQRPVEMPEADIRNIMAKHVHRNEKLLWLSQPTQGILLDGDAENAWFMATLFLIMFIGKQIGELYQLGINQALLQTRAGSVIADIVLLLIILIYFQRPFRWADRRAATYYAITNTALYIARSVPSSAQFSEDTPPKITRIAWEDIVQISCGIAYACPVGHVRFYSINHGHKIFEFKHLADSYPIYKIAIKAAKGVNPNVASTFTQ